MTLILAVCAVWLLVRPGTAMDAVSAACRLFVTGVMPGLLPYMTVTLMLVSRLHRPLRPWQLVLMGWCGGSPCGARLLREAGNIRHGRRIAAACATMSPMFLAGTLGRWLDSPRAGTCILIAGISGGLAAAALAGGDAAPAGQTAPPARLSLGQAVENTARTLLTVCGIMALMRLAAALAAELVPAALVITTLLEVTSGAEIIAGLPLPLPMRTAIIAGATGFGGASLLMQNRAVIQLFSLPEQIALQAVHGAVSFLVALGLMLL
ncbi:MAG: hypothetical protein IKK21_11050 [Clostridia bacterium]|nr:hypothetical protein [Clostridia bacterium]